MIDVPMPNRRGCGCLESHALPSEPASTCGEDFNARRNSAPGDKTYIEMVSAFYSGVAALDVDAKDRAKTALTCATVLFAGEPAGWANLGLLELRLGDQKRLRGIWIRPQSWRRKTARSSAF